MTSIPEKEIIQLLSLRGSEQRELHSRASRLRDENVSSRVYIRGLIEFSNICINDCYYCGIRKSNSRVKRYELSIDEISETVDEIAAAGLSSIVLQSGERNDRRFIDYVSDILNFIKGKNPGLVITLSSGEQSIDTYRRFFECGASRYLLRIETSDEDHYSKLHPDSMSFDRRVRCLRDLREIG